MTTTTIGEHIRLRRARNHQTIRHNAADDDPPLTHVVPPISQPTRFCNSAMSSFSLLTSSNEPTKKKQLGFPQAASFRGINCTASAAAHEVSVPSAIRSSADWDNKKKKRNRKKKKKKVRSYEDGSVRFLSESRDVDGGNGCVAVPDVWCGPGLGFSTDAVSVDPPRRNLPSSSRRKIDVDKNNPNQTEVKVLALCSAYLIASQSSSLFVGGEFSFITDRQGVLGRNCLEWLELLVLVASLCWGPCFGL